MDQKVSKSWSEIMQSTKGWGHGTVPPRVKDIIGTYWKGSLDGFKEEETDRIEWMPRDGGYEGMIQEYTESQRVATVEEMKGKVEELKERLKSTKGQVEEWEKRYARVYDENRDLQAQINQHLFRSWQDCNVVQ